MVLVIKHKYHITMHLPSTELHLWRFVSAPPSLVLGLLSASLAHQLRGAGITLLSAGSCLVHREDAKAKLQLAYLLPHLACLLGHVPAEGRCDMFTWLHLPSVPRLISCSLNHIFPRMSYVPNFSKTFLISSLLSV